jgi:hypothetical protein
LTSAPLTVITVGQRRPKPKPACRTTFTVQNNELVLPAPTSDRSEQQAEQAGKQHSCLLAQRLLAKASCGSNSIDLSGESIDLSDDVEQQAGDADQSSPPAEAAAVAVAAADAVAGEAIAMDSSEGGEEEEQQGDEQRTASSKVWKRSCGGLSFTANQF